MKSILGFIKGYYAASKTATIVAAISVATVTIGALIAVIKRPKLAKLANKMNTETDE